MGRGIIVRSSDSQSRVHHAWCNFGQVTDLRNLPLYRIGVTLSRRIKEITLMEYGEQCRARSRASQMAPLLTIITIVKVARAQESRKASLYPSIFFRDSENWFNNDLKGHAAQQAPYIFTVKNRARDSP